MSASPPQRCVIVTGGSRGLGAAVVERFLAAGDAVATCSRAPTEAVERWCVDSDVRERFHFDAFDLRDRAALEAFVRCVSDRFGDVQVLVNNAGIAREGVLGLMADEDLEELVELNLTTTVRVTRAIIRRMLVRGAGRVINVSSVVGQTGYRGLSVYSATKAALDGFTRALAREVGARGITVNAVAPGYVQTDMTLGLDERQLQQITRRTPLGRLATAEEVAAAVHFLASPDAAFITGQVLAVDGGLTA